MYRLAGFGLLVASVGLVGLGIQACGGDDSTSTFTNNDNGNNGNGDGEVADGGNPFNPGDGGPSGDGHVCVNLECSQVACPGMLADGGAVTTTISGTVFDPADKVPLYNVVVYVPNAPLDPIKHGASCDKCGVTLSGSPLVATLTDAAGKFTLTNVPVVANLPLVMQVGKWRRVITIPTVAQCVDNPITDKTMTRLPTKPAEGNPMDDIPQIAMTTGGADPLECLPRKIGIADDQFTTNTGTGRVHMYQGQGGSQLMGGSPAAKPFWSSLSNLMNYDIVLMACEGNTYPTEKPAAALQAMVDYTSAGGRVFGSHYHYYWLEPNASKFAATANFNHTGMPDPINGTIDTSFPKGMAFSDWMTNVGATNGPSQFQIIQPRHDVDSIITPTSLRWVYNTPQNAVLYYSFNTPTSATPDMQCGKVVYSDLHVSSGDQVGGTFPGNCTTKNLSPQEKALEFMLFDLSSCIQKDNGTPPPPIPPVN